MKSYPEARLLYLFLQEHPHDHPSTLDLIRWCKKVAQIDSTVAAVHDQSWALIKEVQELYRIWCSELPTWVVETPEPGGTVLSRHIQAPTYEQAIRLAADS